MVEGEELREVSQNWGGTEPKRTVTCMVLKACANDRCKASQPFTAMNFEGLDLTSSGRGRRDLCQKMLVFFCGKPFVKPFSNSLNKAEVLLCEQHFSIDAKR
ncbi:hypothetical protein TNCV_4751861 [Trichonephila clavipes]|nr:hypothetical protein TNCV_4751861 [Trichonephila clavipes]